MSAMQPLHKWMDCAAPLALEEVLLPHKQNRWPEIRRTLLLLIQKHTNTLALVSQLDYIEHLVCLGRSTSRLFDVLPARMTFIGLGNFLSVCLTSTERDYFEHIIFPFIVQCAVELEKLTGKPLHYSVALQDYDEILPYNVVASLIACSFLCLLPSHPQLNFLFNEINFTYFFASLSDQEFNQTQKLLCLLSFFEHCRKNSEPDGFIRITRRTLNVELPHSISVLEKSTLETSYISEAIGPNLVESLASVPLPCMFLDQYSQAEQVADKLHLPLTHFVNAYVGGNVLRSGGFQDDSLFMRYPDLIAALPLCHRLEEFEALWIDHFRGPFQPNRPGSALRETFDEDCTKWRRLVFINSSCFPSWASDLQYSDACIISEVIKATTALYGISTTLQNHSVTPFSSDWWDFWMAKASSDMHPTPSCDTMKKSEPVYAITNRAQRIVDIGNIQAQEVVRKVLERTTVLNSGTSKQSSSLGRQSLPNELLQPIASKAAALVPTDPTAVNSVWANWLQLHPGGNSPAYQSSFRHSLSTSVRSASISTTYPQSSVRSSFSRGHSLSTQSSVRRFSDLSSSGGSRMIYPRTTDGIPSSDLRGLVEDDVEGHNTLVPNTNNGIETEKCTSRTLFELESNAENHVESCSSGRSSLRKETDIPCVESDNYPMPPASGRHREVENYVTRWVEKLFEEAAPIVRNRLNRLTEIADDFTSKAIRSAMHGVCWFDRFTHNILQEVTPTLKESNVKRLKTRTVLTKAVKRSRRRCVGHPYSQCTVGYCHVVSTKRMARLCELDDTESNSSLQVAAEWRARAGMYRTNAHAKTKRAHYARLNRRSERPSYLQKLRCSSPCNTQQIGVHRIHNAAPHGLLENRTPRSAVCSRLQQTKSTTALADQTLDRICESTPAPTLFNPIHVYRSAGSSVYITDQLNRYAESVATTCCIQALQELHTRFISRKNSVATSEVRPTGVVTTSWGKHTINAAADPQLNVITQWIAAAAALSGTRQPRPSSTAAQQDVYLSNEHVASNVQVTDHPVNNSTDRLPRGDDPHSIGVGLFPIVVCTNKDPRLNQLGSIIRLIYAANCSAGSLLSLLFDYGAYRLGSTNCGDSTSGQSAKQPYVSLFEFLTMRLQTPLTM